MARSGAFASRQSSPSKDQPPSVIKRTLPQKASNAGPARYSNRDYADRRVAVTSQHAARRSPITYGTTYFARVLLAAPRSDPGGLDWVAVSESQLKQLRRYMKCKGANNECAAAAFGKNPQ